MTCGAAASAADSDGDGIDDVTEGLGARVIDTTTSTYATSMSQVPPMGVNVTAQTSGFVVTDTSSGSTLSFDAVASDEVSSEIGTGTLSELTFAVTEAADERLVNPELSFDTVGGFDDGLVLQVDGVTVISFDIEDYRDNESLSERFGIGGWTPWKNEGNPRIVYDEAGNLFRLLLDDASGGRSDVLEEMPGSRPNPVPEFSFTEGVTLGLGYRNGGGPGGITEHRLSFSAELRGAIDTDGDGVPDYLDDDSDGDGITDVTEGGDDADGDGLPNSQDTDSDNDGVPDAIAGSGDRDGDGIADYLDDDIDGDGVSNVEETQPGIDVDSDGDGLPDFLDSDSDNDGVSDGDEGRGDADGDGMPDFADSDADGDGIPDGVEGAADSDNDGVADLVDLDADNDGIPDVREGAGDADGDGVPDARDLDSDNDGLPDILEVGGADANGDGRVDDYVDNDGDGLDDGVSAIPLIAVDTDSDGVADYLDRDADNDGLPDTRESALASLDADGDGRIDTLVDGNGDGWQDNVPVPITIDSDEDGVPNHLDLDSDGDGLFDLVEAGGSDADGDGIIDVWLDSDADGIPDSVDADLFPDQDSDGDGIADFADADFLNEMDSDGDGIADRLDVDPFSDGLARAPNGEPMSMPVLPDTDGDGVPDVFDAMDGTGIVSTGLNGGSIGPASLILLGLPLMLRARRRRSVMRSRRPCDASASGGRAARAPLSPD